MQQVNLFECLEKYRIFDAWLSDDENSFSPEEYLKKGEKITTLMREKIHRSVFSPLDCISPSVFAKKERKSEKLDYAIGRIAESVVRPVLNEISAIQETELSKVMAVLPAAIRNEVHMKLCTEQSYEGRLMQAFFRKKNVTAVGVIVEFGDKQFLCCLNGKISKSCHKVSYRMRYSSVAWKCADMGLLLAEIILIGELLNQLRKMREIGEEGTRLEESLNEAWCNCIKVNLKNGCLHVSNKVVENNIFCEWMDKENVPYYVTDGGRVLDVEQLLPLQVMTDRDVSLQSFFSPYGLHFLENVFCVMVQEHIRDKQVRRYYTELNRDRATVWQTKKNIPEKVIRAMSESGFNDFFGYVEFDEDCELSKLLEIEREFRALNTVFKISKQEDVSLRFRKLGNHKASGLYFPSIHCLCVDIRTPSSMAHECMHMIDHMHGMLCRKSAFYPVECAYIAAFENALSQLPKDDPQKIAMNRKQKYNREYYLQPMEIFARCGEIYLTRVLGIDNSLCVPEYGVAYPDDELLEESIKKYFGMLFFPENYTEEEFHNETRSVFKASI